MKGLVKTEKDWLGHKRTSKDGKGQALKDIKGLVRTEKDWLGHKRTRKDMKGLVRTEKD